MTIFLVGSKHTQWCKILSRIGFHVKQTQPKSLVLIVGEGSPTTTLVVEAVFPNIGLPTPVTKGSHRPLDRQHRSRSKVTKPMAMVAKAESPTTRTVTYQPNGRGEAAEWFQKMFYQIFRDKIFYNFLQRILHSTENIYKFDYILLANKHLKMEKHFLKNILLQNKRSIIRNKNSIYFPEQATLAPRQL